MFATLFEQPSRHGQGPHPVVYAQAMPRSQEQPIVIFATTTVATLLDRLCTEAAHAINQEKYVCDV